MGQSLRHSLKFVPVELGFGTSGLRGRVVDLSSLEVAINTLGFLRFLASTQGLKPGDTVWLAGDLRPSTTQLVEIEGLPRGRMLQAVAWSVARAGYQPGYLGLIPSPALMAYGLSRHQASVMVTGSHIPFDRNGIKFNKPDGEVLKTDEAAILESVRQVRAEILQQSVEESPFSPDGQLKPAHRRELPIEDPKGREAYLNRYVEAFPAGGLKNHRLLVYQHSAVGRDLLVELLQRLGASVIAAGRSETFIPVDTEAVQPSMIRQIQELVDAHGGEQIQAVVSTDGDSDRPLLLGLDGGRVRFFGGDLLGIVTASYFNARHVAVPISANDAVDRFFQTRGVQVIKTRIGSPHVIAAMREVGWEANGGFLTARECSVPGGGVLSPLPTRDAFLPLLSALYASLGQGLRVVDCFAKLPQRFGKADVVREFPREVSLGILSRFLPGDSRIEETWFEGGKVRLRMAGSEHPSAGSEDAVVDLRRRQAALQAAFGSVLGGQEVNWINWCDGCRFSTTRGEILHLRPSGNAPEQRVYAVADSPARVEHMVRAVTEPGGVLENLRTALAPGPGAKPSLVQAPSPDSGAPAHGSADRSGTTSTPPPPILRLHGIVQHYDWGGTSFLPELLSLPNPKSQPHAELWLGAHASASSRVDWAGTTVALRDYLQQHAPVALGPSVSRSYGGELPYLLKILDARQMLSIQAHPDPDQARAGYAREEAAGIPLHDPKRNYKDPYPKPEVHVALTPFWMLHGFRPLEQLVEESQRHPELAYAWPGLADELRRVGRDTEGRQALLQQVYERVMQRAQSEVDAILRPLLERLQRQAVEDKSDRSFWLRRAAQNFARSGAPCDRGLLSIFLLNLVWLEPGQSTFQKAGVLHAYLEGATVELMAGSDNVLRGGLTSKHVDVAELLRIVRFEEGGPAVSTGTPIDPRETVFETPAREFELTRCILAAGEQCRGRSDQGPECLVVTEGAIHLVSEAGTERFTRGQSAWINWNVDYRLQEDGAGRAVVFRARMPAGSSTAG